MSAPVQSSTVTCWDVMFPLPSLTKNQSHRLLRLTHRSSRENYEAHCAFIPASLETLKLSFLLFLGNGVGTLSGLLSKANLLENGEVRAIVINA